MASRIVALMPPHTHYVEPYAGGLSVLLAKDPEGVSEVVNDLNQHLSNFWQVLQFPHLCERFARIVSAMPFSEVEWNVAKRIVDIMGWHGELPDQGRVLRAVNFFVACRQSLAGRMGTFAPLSRTRTRRGMNEQVSAWLNAVEGLPEVHARLKRVVILNRPALDVIRQQDGPRTCFYLDPPYLHETRSTTKEYGQYEMSDVEHLELLEFLGAVEGKFLLSGYRSELYDDKAKQYGWNRHDFEISNHAAGGDSKRRMTECVWTNV